MICKLILPQEPECSGKVLNRTLSIESAVECCEKHWLAFEQLYQLAQLGYTSEELKNSTLAQRVLWLKEEEN